MLLRDRDRAARAVKQQAERIDGQQSAGQHQSQRDGEARHADDGEGDRRDRLTDQQKNERVRNERRKVPERHDKGATMR